VGPGRRRERVRIALFVYRITTYVAIAYKHLGAPLTQLYEPLEGSKGMEPSAVVRLGSC